MLLRRFFLALSLLAGLAASQLPEFAQQYRQRLGGAIDELTRHIDAFAADAGREGLTPPAAIDRLKDNPDALARGRAAAMLGMTERRDRLRDQLAALRESAPLRSLAVIFGDLDPLTAKGAMRDYEPAVPLSTESLLLALSGFLAIFALGRACDGLRRRRPRPAMRA